MPDYENQESSGPEPLTAEQVVELYTQLQGHYVARNARYDERRRLYRGEHWGTSLLPIPDGAEQGKKYTLVLNYIRPTVDKAVQRLFGTLPGIQVMPPGAEEPDRRRAEGEEALLYSTWYRNNAEEVFRRAGHNMALLDQGILYYWWDPQSECVRFKSVAPDNFYPLYDGDELIECLLVSRRLTRSLKQKYPSLADKITSDNGPLTATPLGEGDWPSNSSPTGDLFDSTRFDGDNVRTPLEGSSEFAAFSTVLDWYDRHGNWVRIMGNAVHKQKLNYKTGKVPVVILPNNVPGDDVGPQSEVHDVIELNLYLNQLASQMGDFLRRFASPTVLDKQSGQSAHEIRQTIQAEGGVLPIKRDGDLEYLEWSGTTPDFGAQWDRVLMAIQDISGNPASAYGQIMSNQSGTASNMAMSPATHSTEEKMGLAGQALSELNQAILMLNETFMKGKSINVHCSAPKRPGIKAMTTYNVTLEADDIGGWYQNRIKWPSILRTDDPIYIQNELAKAQATADEPPKQSLYTTLENLGTEDVEAEIDRIGKQLEDPRLHPSRLTSAVDAAMAMQGGGAMDPAMAGLDPAGAPVVDPDIDAALNASGSPHGTKSTKTKK